MAIPLHSFPMCVFSSSLYPFYLLAWNIKNYEVDLAVHRGALNHYGFSRYFELFYSIYVHILNENIRYQWWEFIYYVAEGIVATWINTMPERMTLIKLLLALKRTYIDLIMNEGKHREREKNWQQIILYHSGIEWWSNLNTKTSRQLKCNVAAHKSEIVAHYFCINKHSTMFKSNTSAQWIG